MTTGVPAPRGGRTGLLLSPWSLRHLFRSQGPRTGHLTGKLRPQAGTLAAFGVRRGNLVPFAVLGDGYLSHPEYKG